MVVARRDQGRVVARYAPNDTPESIIHDIKVIQKELPVDLLEFFYLTPLPGSEDHKKLHEAGAWMDADMNKYDLNHAVAEHQNMSRQQWEAFPRSAKRALLEWIVQARTAPTRTGT